MKLEYTKQDIAEAINRTVRNIKYWTDIGIIEPEGKPARGRGHVRTYSRKNLVEFAMADYMATDLHLPLEDTAFALHCSGVGEELLNKKFGVEYERFFAYTHGATTYMSVIADSGKITVDEGTGQSRDHGHIRPRVPWDRFGEWLDTADTAAFTVLRLGDIRNKALAKHGIKLEGIG